MTSGQPHPSDQLTAPAVQPTSSSGGLWLGVLAVILGAIGCLLPLAPFDLAGSRAHIALAFALPGLLLGVIGCVGRRRDNAAVTGVVLSGVALGLAVVMLVLATPKSSPNSFPDDRTAEILHHDLDVRLGERLIGADGVSVTVTLRNKGLKAASFRVTVQVTGSGGVCDDLVSVDDLSPGASYQDEVRGCSPSKATPPNLDLKVTKAVKE